jgi:MFS family permease
VELGLRTLPAAGGDQHVDVVRRSATAEVRLIDPLRIDAFGDEQFTVRGHCTMDASQNRRRAIVVPVVDDVLDDVRFSAGRHFVEEVATDSLASRLQSRFGDLGARFVGGLRQVEDDPVQIRIRIQNADQQRAIASAYVDQRTEWREIVRCGDRGRGQRSEGRHRLVENSRHLAYIADVTPPEKRAGAFGMLSAAFGLGFVLGPALGGVFGEIDPRLPFWVAAGLSLLNAAYGLFVLPESLAHDRRAIFKWQRANPIGALTLLRSNFELLGLAVVMFISYIAHEALPTTFVLYAMYRYHWNARMIGLAIATVGVCSALVGAGMVQPLVAKFGERRTMLTGLWFNVAGFIAYALAPTGLIFWSAIPLGAMGGLSGPPMQGLMTRQVTPTEQGQLREHSVAFGVSHS